MTQARLDEDTLHHMFGYVEEHLHTGGDLNVLGYLDTKHWIDALGSLPLKFRPSIKKWAKRVDEQYNTNFLRDINEYLKENELPMNAQAIKDWIKSNRPDLASNVDDLLKQDSFILIASMGFEAGRKFQKDSPEFPDGVQSYL